MSENALNVVANAIGAAAFAVALGGVLAMPTRPGGFMRHGVKLLLAGAMSVHLFVGLSHVLQFAQITPVFDIFENYLKVLFIPLIACAAYALWMNEQLRTMRHQAEVLTAEHDILMRVVDTTPTGVVVLDSGGRIEFANDRAREILELEDDPETYGIATPKWTCGDALDCTRGDLSACLCESEARDVLCTLLWPDGTTRCIVLHATPIVSADGRRVGSVAAFTSADPPSAASAV